MSPASPIPEPEPTPTSHGPRAGPAPASDGQPVASTPHPDGAADGPAPPATPRRLRRQRPPAGRRLARPEETCNIALTPEQRLLALDAWRRSGLPAGDFAPLVGVSKHTLYAWKHKFDLEGPAGLLDHPRGSPTGSRLPEVTRRAILMLKESNPDWGCERIAAMLVRGPALPAGRPLLLDAGGVAAISRWSSEAIPPVTMTRNESTPAGLISRGSRRCDPSGVDRCERAFFRGYRCAQPPANRCHPCRDARTPGTPFPGVSLRSTLG